MDTAGVSLAKCNTVPPGDATQRGRSRGRNRLGCGHGGPHSERERAHIEKAAAELLRDDAPHIHGNPQHLRVALAMRHIVMAEMLERLS
ncbi:hypothetical protein HS961_03090 [Comamonas piscis]|uniref:Uncharacterized protein n=1 Tax=Comamonas piscis TaxID=1562974 RepID=A0A7G5ED21_9BURK|nr:hypothetical protein [Comamonas piscis]QMV71896.1 hypothetical protein HS961_03090 [Comamonas piscis]WSO34635.1 hypothetical protein VUJ63_03110 [Comamonas piscis]